MSAEPASLAEAVRTRSAIMWFLAVASAAAILVVFTLAWFDSRKTPTVIFLATPNTAIAVDVRGAVSTPGVIYLDPGDRLVDVIETAGGLAPNADRALINLSSRVSDGQMIMIPTQVPFSDDGPTQSSGLININTASADDLKQLPGIGDVLAGRIVAFREATGPFLTVDELGEVDGISPGLIETLQPYITVTNND